MKYPAIVGLIGKKRVGKDTFADVLVNEYDFARVAFADPLREAALRLDPIVYPASEAEDFTGEVWRYSEALAEYGYERAKDLFPEVRRILQYLGTDAIRTLDDDFWIRAWKKRTAEALAVGPVVVPDVRFPNEADTIRNAGGLIVRITRDAVASNDGHASENALDFYREDVHIPNNYSEDAFRRLARDLARDLPLVVKAAHRRNLG